jgi:hypothetical protein
MLVLPQDAVKILFPNPDSSSKVLTAKAFSLAGTEAMPFNSRVSVKPIPTA